MIKDREGNTVPDNGGQEKFLGFLYNNPFGFLLLKLLSRRFIANLGRVYMSSPLSKRRIGKLIKSAGIDMSEYEPGEYRSFNEFFVRKIKPEARPFDSDPGAAVSPADSKLTVCDVGEDSVYRIKSCDYRIKELLGDEDEAKYYLGGKCFIYRLSVDNYHRYHHIDPGRELYHRFIPGALHTVNPVALEKYDVVGKNCRELTVIETENFGRVAFIEVGAMMVGRITNCRAESFSRGDEKGYFSFGGSTIVVLYGKDRVAPDADIAANSAEGIETAVKCGEKVGTAKSRV